MEHSVAQGLERRGKVKVTHMSIDEKAVRRGHKYATILSDSETGVVLDLAGGRGYLETRSLVEKTLSEAHRAQVVTFTMDMWAPYIKVWRELLQDAKLIHDRFHLVKMLNIGIDKVRRREVKKHPELRHGRFALLKNPENRTEKQEEIFQLIIAANTQVAKAWVLREDFKAISECNTLDEATTYFKL